MKKKILLGAMLCALGMMISCNSNSEKTSWEVDGIHGKVKTDKVSIYEAVVKFGETQKGELEDYADHPLLPYSKFSCISITSYNENGMRASIDSYDEDMELRSKSVFAFEGKKLSSVKTYDDDGELDYESTLTYDSKTGKLKEQINQSYSKYGPYLFHYKYSYDEDGTLYGETYREDGTVEKWSVKETKKKGKVQKRVQCNEQGEPTIITLFDDEERVLSVMNKTDGDSISYVYNENGDVINLIVTSYECKDDYCDSISINDSTPVIEIDTDQKANQPTKVRKTTEYKFEYDYDKHNNWKKRITYKGIKPLYIEEREIEYY